ncbi:nitrate- and nitrite sensing domain-containing protein [Streptomyces sp. NPDC013178]|uniref:sensor histidine kinase n=1 Tax=Streptomyces sp. NPDC013178 TaxID=3155118 RepID=UPI0033D07FC0
MKRHGWSLRGKITALLLLPLLSLSALWSYAAYLSLNNALTLVHVDTIGNHLARPLGRVFIGLQTERRVSLEALVSEPATVGRPGRTAHGASIRDQLTRSRTATDQAVAEFSEHATMEEVRDNAGPEVHHSVEAARKALDSLGSLRQGVDGRRVDVQNALVQYSDINAAISAAFEAMTVLPDQEAQRFGHSLYTHTLGSDYLSQEDALISAIAASGRMTRASYALVVQNIGASRRLFELALRFLPDAQRKAFTEATKADGPMGDVRAMEEQFIHAGPDADRLPFSITRWRAAYDVQWSTTNELALETIEVLFTLTGPPAERALWELSVAAVAGLTALIVSLAMSVRIGRSVVQDVSRLRDSARNLTEDRLRDVVGRLRRGEQVDIVTDMTRPRFVHREMADLGEAFFALQTTAVELAAEDVRLHQRVSDVFVNLARRSQTLVHRQLGLLDAMEHREDHPERLAELYRLDQIAMHLRRYAESLIIVSGSSTGRVWRHPVPAVDVIRGAAAETEDYARVSVLSVPAVGIAGRAVADIAHLLAELIENAQNFSPADSQVRVGAGLVTRGLVIEVDDRGLGMNAEDLAAANAKITQRVDLSDLDSTCLGLVTVGRLAQRHDLSVVLRHSSYGGVTAAVLIPSALLEEAQAAEGGAPADGGHGGPRGRTARSSGRGVPAGVSASPASAGVTGAEPYPALPGPPADRHGGAAPGDPGSPAGGDLLRSLDADLYGHPADAAGGHPGEETHQYEAGGPYHHSAPAHPIASEPYDGPGQGTVDGLPRRVPQASLSPQLRHDAPRSPAPSSFDWEGKSSPAPETMPPGHERVAPGGALPPAEPFGTTAQGPARAPVDDLADRPAQARSLMAALQAGTARGRLAGPRGAYDASHAGQQL